MERPRDLIGVPFDEAAVIDSEQDNVDAESTAVYGMARMATKSRSMSDSGGTPSKPSPSPSIVDSRRMSKDDSNLKNLSQPVTPRRAELRGLSIQMPPHQFTPPSAASSSAYIRPAPLSPKLDHSQIFASPTNLLPRRSRGLDFSRAATSLHHSILAEQPDADSSPIAGDGAISIPTRRSEYGGSEQTSTSLWSMMRSQEKMNVSGSLGSNHGMGSDLSSSSDDDIMDEDMDESYLTTPQVCKMSRSMGHAHTSGPFGSPAMSSLTSFQQRQRPRKQSKKKTRGSFGLGFNLAAAALSKSPPRNTATARARRESISWQANQLQISPDEKNKNGQPLSDIDGANGDQRGVIRRAVTRRGNLLPKTKTFARIRAALAEEGSPAEADFIREAKIVKQVRESDVDLEARFPPIGFDCDTNATAQSSPNLTNQDSLDDIATDDVMGGLAMGLSSSFKQHAMKKSKGKQFWDTFSESSSMGEAKTPPTTGAFLPRGSSSGMSEDATMDSPSLGQTGFQPTPSSGPYPPSAAEITRRINNKRRRDEDLDATSFKRRAVSPGMSVHNSPIVQSPLQRDSMPWGSRPGSTGVDRGSSGQSESPSISGTPAYPPSGSMGQVNRKGRVGLQGMVDTHDGIMRMSIE